MINFAALMLLIAATSVLADGFKVSKQLNFNPSPADSALPNGVDPDTGFRMAHYRRPVPQTNPGTEVINTTRAFELHESGLVQFIDVYPPRGLGADPIDGNWITNEVHRSMPGAIWLPEVGRGFLDTEHIEYFERNLQLLTDADKTRAIVFYCTADCWQSWNAARRALQWGYKTVYWYPAGTDGWQQEGHPLVVVEPVNFFGGSE